MKDILASKWLSDIEESNAVRFLHIPNFTNLPLKLPAGTKSNLNKFIRLFMNTCKTDIWEYITCLPHTADACSNINAKDFYAHKWRYIGPDWVGTRQAGRQTGWRAGRGLKSGGGQYVQYCQFRGDEATCS